MGIVQSTKFKVSRGAYFELCTLNFELFSVDLPRQAPEELHGVDGGAVADLFGVARRPVEADGGDVVERVQVAVVRVHPDPVEDLDEILARGDLREALVDDHRDVALQVDLEDVRHGGDVEVVPDALDRIGSAARPPAADVLA